MSIERLYGKLKTHKMEQEQRQIIYGPGTVDNKIIALLRTATLVVNNCRINKTMAYMAGKFRNLLFRKNPKYKFKSGSNFGGSSGSSYKGNRDGSSSGVFQQI